MNRERRRYMADGVEFTEDSKDCDECAMPGAHCIDITKCPHANENTQVNGKLISQYREEAKS